MNKIFYIVLILFALASCSKSNGTIIGTASADGGAVVSGITVKLYTNDTHLIRTTTTDNEGNFSFHDLENDNYYIGATVTVGSDIWDTGTRPQIVYVNDEIVKEVTLTLSKR